jgi:hypothetical protein
MAQSGSQTIHVSPSEEEYPGTPRNAPCPCNSGKKYKRCCGKWIPKSCKIKEQLHTYLAIAVILFAAQMFRPGLCASILTPALPRAYVAPWPVGPQKGLRLGHARDRGTQIFGGAASTNGRETNLFFSPTWPTVLSVCEAHPIRQAGKGWRRLKGKTQSMHAVRHKKAPYVRFLVRL